MYVRSAKSVNASSGSESAPRNGQEHNVCQAPGCSLEIPLRHLMCNTHWFELPPTLQRNVNLNLVSWFGGTQNLYPYMIARLEAIIYVGKLHGEDVNALETKLNSIKEKSGL
jgi:coproporphyrinogen III oxidase